MACKTEQSWYYQLTVVMKNPIEGKIGQMVVHEDNVPWLEHPMCNIVLEGHQLLGLRTKQLQQAV